MYEAPRTTGARNEKDHSVKQLISFTVLVAM